MTIDAPEIPTGSFADQFDQSQIESEPDVEAVAAATVGAAQTVELFVNGASIGWLGQDSSQWCIATQNAAVSLEAYVYKQVLYYRNAADTSRYLSVSDRNNNVGFYNWNGARGWTLNGNVLTSLYTSAQLSFWSTDNGYVYANSGSGYSPITVQFH